MVTHPSIPDDDEFVTEEGEPVASIEGIKGDSSVHGSLRKYEPGEEENNFCVGDEVYIDFVPATGDNHDGFHGTIVAGKETKKEVQNEDDTYTVYTHDVRIKPNESADVQSIITVHTDRQGDYPSPVFTNERAHDFPHEVFGIRTSLLVPEEAADMLMCRAESKYERRMEKMAERQGEYRVSPRRR